MIDANIKEGLEKILPNYQISYLGDFRLSNQFVLAYNDELKGIITIQIDNEKQRLGEVIKITLLYEDNKKYFEVPLLKEARLSNSKLEARLINELYYFLIQCNNDK